MIADLHVHTAISDCSDTPRQVFEQAKRNGVQFLAITDHDTLHGQEEHLALSKELALSYIPGVEVSAYDYERSVPCHIVGLFPKVGYNPLEEMLSLTTKQRHHHSNLQIELLMEMGYRISFEDFVAVTGYHGIYKQHIMDVLMKKGYASELYGSFYKKLFKGNGPLFMEIKYPSHIEAVKVLANSGAYPILAHPTLYQNQGCVKELVDSGLFGIEVNYPGLKKEDQSRLIQIANEYHLFQSGGSDYHGRYGDHSVEKIGSHGAIDIEMIMIMASRHIL